MRSEHRYALGHDAFEIERLQLQSTVIGSVTRRLIEQSEVRPGMHVLDIGCGVGDVSMLLTEAVGETGSVVAFDREPRAIAVARARALAAGYRCIEFVMASDELFPIEADFDAAVGRYILAHLADPLATIRRAAAAVCHGGIVAFHEPASEVAGRTFPSLDLYVSAERRLNAAFRATLPHIDSGCRLLALFEEAGLSAPHMFWESIVGGPVIALAVVHHDVSQHVSPYRMPRTRAHRSGRTGHAGGTIDCGGHRRAGADRFQA